MQLTQYCGDDSNKNLRQKIRATLRRDVELRDDNTPAGVDRLYKLLQTSYGRARVPLLGRDLFEATLEHLPKECVRIRTAFENEHTNCFDYLPTLSQPTFLLVWWHAADTRAFSVCLPSLGQHRVGARATALQSTILAERAGHTRIMAPESLRLVLVARRFVMDGIY